MFGQPQIGSVGLTEDECEAHDIPYRDTILGFHAIGPEAAELIHEVVVAMNAGDGRAGTVRRAIHVHPTLAELVGAAFDDA